MYQFAGCKQIFRFWKVTEKSLNLYLIYASGFVLHLVQGKLVVGVILVKCFLVSSNKSLDTIILLGVVHFSSISRANKTYNGGKGDQGQFTLFPKLKNDDIILAKSSFYCFFIRTLLGWEVGVLKKECFCTFVKMMEKKNVF